MEPIKNFVRDISARWSTDSDAVTDETSDMAKAPAEPEPEPIEALAAPTVGTAFPFSAEKPLPFIQIDPETKTLVITDAARQALSQLDGSIGVCAVAGLYRTGKSYILNQLAGQNAGFGIGSSVQAHTKGVWVWGAPLAQSADIPGGERCS